jgi:hypothetical protein
LQRRVANVGRPEAADVRQHQRLRVRLSADLATQQFVDAPCAGQLGLHRVQRILRHGFGDDESRLGNREYDQALAR